MTISVRRLLTVIAAAAAVTAASVLVWEEAHTHRGPSSFESGASAICRQQLPAIRRAPTVKDAVARSREMRIELSVLAPAPSQRATFEDWISRLQATEDAALRGDFEAVREADLAIQEDVQQLGVADACLTAGPTARLRGVTSSG